MNKQAGISLLEMLISLFLISMIIILLMQCYLSNKRQYNETQKLLTLRFDLQWVSELLSDSIRRAGFTPCLGIDKLHTEQKIPSLIIKNTPQQLLQINHMSHNFTRVIRINSPTTVIISQNVTFKIHHPILIADCEHAEIHQILSIDKLNRGYQLTLSKPLQFSYQKVTYLGEWLEEQWIIKQNAQKNGSLYYKLFQAEELTPLVHSLEAKREIVREKQLVHVILGLDHNKTHDFFVAVRGS